MDTAVNLGLMLILCLGFALAACACSPPPHAAGTLEYDRIRLPAVAAERVASIDVGEEGSACAPGRACFSSIRHAGPSHASLAAVVPRDMHCRCEAATARLRGRYVACRRAVRAGAGSEDSAPRTR